MSNTRKSPARHQGRRRALAIAVGAASLFGGVALEAQERRAIEEVVVTAQQRAQSLQDVPISISAFNNEAIESAMMGDVGDYVARTPNASFVSNGARSRRQISMRGITNFAGENSPVRSSTFGFYIDGFNLASASINPPVMDVERIEILRGPQATYFGRNALGGGINMTTVEPDSTAWGGSFMVDYARYDTRDIEGILNVPIIEDVLAARINVKQFSTDGNIENINPTGGGNDADYDYYRLAVKFTPSDRLTLTFNASDGEEDVGMREGVPSGVFSTFAGGTLFASFPDRDGDGLADPDPDGVGFYPENDSKVNFNTPQSVGTEVEYYIGRLDYDFDSMRFTSITGYMESDFFLQGDIDGGSGDYFNEFRTIPRESFTQEFRLVSTADSALTWNLGFFYSDDEGFIDNKTFVGAAQPFGLPDGFLIDSEETAEAAETWAVFGQVDYQLTEKLSVSVGGRYSEEKIESDISGFSGEFSQELFESDKFTDFSPRFSARYDVSDNANVYATISKGFKSGGVQISPLPDASSYDPEELWNYEIGLKGDFLDRRLRVNASAFLMEWTDMQASFQQAGTDENGNFILFGGIDNADSATSKGVEVSLTALPTDNLVFNLDVGYLDAEFDEFTAFIDGANRVLDGAVIPNSPKWTVSANAEYTRTLSTALEGFARLEWIYRDEIRPSTASLIQEGFPWEVPSYDFANLRVGVRHDSFTLTAYAENVLGEDYYTNAYQKAFMGGLFIEPSIENYGVRFRYTF